MSAHERERLSAYLDGELTAAERAAVASHVAACPECAGLLAAFAAVDEEAGSLPAEAPDGYFEGFSGRVTARLAKERAHAARPRRLPGWAWAAAAVLLLAVVTPLTLKRAPAVAPAPVPVAPAAAPEASPPPAHDKRDEPRPQESVLPAVPRKAAPPLVPAPAPAAPTVPAEAKAEAEADFARAPVQAAPARADAVRAEAAGELAVSAESTPPASDRAREGPVGGAAPSFAPTLRSAEGAPAPGGKAAVARTPEEWRRLRDEWNAFAASAPASPRADEARVRAIEAGWEAWRLSGSDDDEAAFRRDARAYLEREDALRKPRVERLLAQPRRAP